MSLHGTQKKYDQTYANLRDQTYANVKKETILVIKIDSKLFFYVHIKELWNKAPQKVSALARIVPYLETSQKVFKPMIKLQLSYCPLPSMFC